MRARDSDGFSVRPEVSERACGGFLAVSPEEAPLRIGVEGDTAEDARAKFAFALARWTEILET